MRRSTVMQKLRNDGWALSVGATFSASSKVTELAGLIGFDCLWIDMEHRAFDYHQVFQMIQGGRAADADCMVRIRKTSDAELFRPLEDGAAGVMVPHCRTPEEAAYIVGNCKYPPLGARGMDGVGPDADYGLVSRDEYFAYANRETFVAVQIEDRDSVDAVGEIAAVEGIDIVFIGSGDLTVSLGTPGDTTNPEFLAAVEQVAKAAERAGVAWGLPAGTPELARRYLDMGARFIHSGSDLGALRAGLQSLLDSYRAL